MGDVSETLQSDTMTTEDLYDIGVEENDDDVLAYTYISAQGENGMTLDQFQSVVTDNKQLYAIRRQNGEIIRIGSGWKYATNIKPFSFTVTDDYFILQAAIQHMSGDQIPVEQHILLSDIVELILYKV
jgi:hypothetical protein